MAKFDWKSSIFGGAISGLFGLNKKKKMKRRSTLDPQQQALYTDYVNSIRNQGPFSDLYQYDTQGSNRNFDMNVARPAYRNFQENIIPNITGQFRSNNLANSSYLGEALSRQGRDVQENLDALRSNTMFQGQQQANVNKQNALQNILGMTTFDYERPAPSTLDQILGSVGPAAAQYASQYFNTPPKAGFGSQANRNVLNMASNIRG